MGEINLSGGARRRARAGTGSRGLAMKEAYAGLAETVRTAGAAIAVLEKEVENLDARLAVPRALVIDTSSAVEGLRAVLDMESRVGASRSGGTTDATYGYEPSEPLDSYASGTDYVPRTGLYRLHQGEKVVPSTETRGTASSVAPAFNITFAPGSIAISGATRSPEEIAAAIAKPLQKKLEELARKAGTK